MKAVVLAAGEGTRLRPLTPDVPKHLIPVANRPLIAYSFDVCRALGVSDVILVLHPSMAGTEAQLRPVATGLRLHPVYQPKPRGLADAVRVAGPLIGNERFLLLLSDSLVDVGALTTVRSALLDPGSAVCVAAVADPRRYGIAELRDGYVTRLVEKPRVPTSPLALIGVYVLEPSILEAIERTTPSARGELEITDAIDLFVRSGHAVRGVELSGAWIDAGDPDGLLAANRMGLAGLPADNDEAGAVAVHPTARVTDSVLHGPVTIGAHVSVRSSTVGPDTSLGAGCIVQKSRVSDSIIMDGVAMEGVDAERVIVGADTRIHCAGAARHRLRDRVIGHRQRLRFAPTRGFDSARTSTTRA